MLVLVLVVGIVLVDTVVLVIVDDVVGGGVGVVPFPAKILMFRML